MAVAQGRTGNYVVFPGYAKLFTLLERNEQPLAALEGLGRGALRERFPGGGSGFRGGARAAAGVAAGVAIKPKP